MIRPIFLYTTLIHLFVFQSVTPFFRLYYQIHGKGVSAKTTTKRSSRHNPNPDWIAFQNFSDVTPADSDEGCDAVEDEDDNVVDERADGGAVDCSGEDEMVQQHLEVEVSRQRAPDHKDGQRIPTSEMCVRDIALTHNLPIAQCNTLNSKPATDSMAAHNMVPHNGQQLKLNDMDITYSNIPPHNPAYTDTREHNLPAQALPGSSVCGMHLGRDIFSIQQAPWENFNIAHQQTTASSIQQQHSLGFQDLNYQNSPTSYMILPNSGYHNTGSHFIPPQENIDQHLQHQNTITHPVSTVMSIAESNSSHPYSSWNQARPHYNVHTTHAYSQPQDSRAEQLLLPKHTSNQVSATRKMPIKNAIKKKKKTLKDLNMKHVTKRWMDKKPKVEAETQNLASEVLQTILLADEAEKLKVRLLTFFTDLESKLMSNPKIFVPGVRHFLNVGEKTEDDNQLVSFLNDFGKTEQSIIKDLETKRNESRGNHSTQTRLSGPVFRLGNVKLKNRNIKSDKCRKKAAHMKQTSQSQGVQKQKSKVIKNLSTQPKRILKSSHLTETLGSFPPQQKNECNLKTKNTQVYIQKYVSTDIMLSACDKQVKKPLTKSFRERQTNPVCRQNNREKCKTKEHVTLDKQNVCSESSLSLQEVPREVTHAFTDLSKKEVVKFSCIRQTS